MQTRYQVKECYWFMHKFSDILNALPKNGITVLEMVELPQEITNNENIPYFNKFPLSYILTGQKIS